MKNKYINAKVSGVITTLIIFLLAHFVLGKDGDGNLLVFGVPAIVGGFIVFFLVRSLDKSASSKNNGE